ncbi:MAG: hypothetical protein ACRD0U_01795, partial [Acidimicrobiales bacterium]
PSWEHGGTPAGQRDNAAVRGPVRVLIVDDQAPFRRAARAVLAGGHETSTPHDTHGAAKTGTATP